MSDQNLDIATSRSFGQEWTTYDQLQVATVELQEIFSQYFNIFPWADLPLGAEGFDLGCGSGRWARYVAPRVGKLHCIDASAEALAVAKAALANHGNCIFHKASVDSIPLDDGSMDFGYALGVLHHVPRPLDGIRSCVSKLKPGAPLLLYLYYKFDNRPRWYRALWKVSDAGRRLISRLPARLKAWTTTAIAGLVYLPLARLSLLLEWMGLQVESMPLTAYRNRSFYSMRTDALDRFGTPLEQRFSATEIRQMMGVAGLTRIEISSLPPHWCAIGYRARC
jgi:SAM-dependent methyltransferase